ncbi:hypothetical protein MMC13_007907 [Lambiella insularis]|nr:hypothetical protein [Lambiella insularis]
MANSTANYPPGYLDQNLGPEAIAIMIPFIVLASLAVVGRLASRKIKNLAWEVDDLVAVFALILTWGCFVCGIICIHYGVGKHVQAVPMVDLVQFKKTLYGFNLIYVTTPPAIKLCILLMYRRLFPTRHFTLAVYILGSVLILWWIVSFVMGVVNCMPIPGFWNPTLSARCINFENYSIGYAVVNISTDLIILTLPIRVVWRLQLPIGQKIGLTFIFLLGSFVCAASLVRLLNAILDLNDPDTTWAFVNAMIWTTIEPSVGVICACLPVMRPLVSALLPTKLRHRFFGHSSAGTNNDTNNSRSRWPTSEHFSRLYDHGAIPVEMNGNASSTTTAVEGKHDDLRDDPVLGNEIRMNAIHVKKEFEVHAV